MLDEQCVLCCDDEEHLVPDLAGLAVGQLTPTTPTAGSMNGLPM